MQKWINKWKDHFQYLLSLGLLSAKERLPNALNDACRLLFEKKTIRHENCAWNIIFLFIVIIFIFMHYFYSLNVSHLRYTFAPRALYHTNGTLCLCVLEKYVWEVSLLFSYLLLDYFNYLPKKRRPTKIQILEEDG